ncbi:MAG: hypothetical protein M3256_06400, partial [Actinomycetota bacterium]|nr:hypothetical protein [Actinomycetota bacterium]
MEIGTEASVTRVGDLELAFFPCRGDVTQTYTVPAGAHSVYVEAVGGQGETPNPDHTGWGGAGSQVTGSLSVNPDDQLPVQVGCKGGTDGGDSPYAHGGARGTGHDKQNFTMSSYGVSGGGGGGATAILSPAGHPLVVAGGGGGGAGGATDCTDISYSIKVSNPPTTINWWVCGPPVRHHGGDGGAAGKPGRAGAVGAGNPYPAAAGGGACGGNAVGGNGQEWDYYGAGGAGGGGGGGYGGGCGGAAAPNEGIPTHAEGIVGKAGNGGGGGLSFADPSVGSTDIRPADNSGSGYVLFLSGADALRTREFAYRGKLESICVPARTDRIFVDAVGGAGGGDGRGFGGIGTGGSGGRVQAVVPVRPATVVGLKVGQFGGGRRGWGDGHGGAHGLASGAGKDGGGGGGSSAVRSTSRPCTATDHGLSEHQYS